MFNFFKPKSIFEKYHQQLSAISVVKNSNSKKVIVASYLFVISDYIKATSGDIQSRNKNASEIFSILENKMLNTDELKEFDHISDLFGKIIRREIPARGVWNLASSLPDNPMFNLYLCFGDLIFSPKYINDYQNAPLVLKGIDEVMNYAMNFSEVLNITQKYINEIGG